MHPWNPRPELPAAHHLRDVLQQNPCCFRRYLRHQDTFLESARSIQPQVRGLNVIFGDCRCLHLSSCESLHCSESLRNDHISLAMGMASKGQSNMNALTGPMFNELYGKFAIRVTPYTRCFNYA